MVDIPGNSSTSTFVTVGSSTVNTLEVTGDHDWFRINLNAGQSITVALNGITLHDPYLRIRDSSGNVIYENDDTNPAVVLDSLLSFQASYTGVYYIDVGAYADQGAGDYQLEVSAWTPPPVFTNDQIAQQLVSGYWGDGSHPFNVSTGGTITVNITALTAAGQSLARTALQSWSEIIGVTFREVTTGGQMTFDDNEEGAWTESSYDGAGRYTTQAHINIDTAWLSDYGTSVGGYAYQAYLHEIGHALGLGHAGNYNTTATYPYDALYQNDAWSTSIMSYFSQQEATYFDNLGFSEAYVVTPMVADIIAMSQLYGLSTTTRSGNTTYGFNNTAGSFYTSALTQNNGYTIFDTGGTDTLDYSGFTFVQRIDLNAEAFSNVGGLTGNVTIARGTVIENAIGGSRTDVIIGNSVGNTLTGNGGSDQLNGNGGDDTLSGNEASDTLTGGAGNDTFRDTRANLNGDTITDFSVGDRIILTDASMSGFSATMSGQTLVFSGGTITLNSPVNGTIVASAAAGGGVQLTIQAAIANDARNDFNGDGRSDVLWRSSTGGLSNWLGQPNGGLVANDANAFVGVSASWQVTGTGDFNGDGRDDILWRSNTGQLSNWLGTASGGWQNNDANAYIGVATSWKVDGVGDFNGDGRDDILWRNDNGQLSNWLGTASGGFTTNDANAYIGVTTDWNVVAVGDFNGDGRDDILWRGSSGHISNWLGTASGGWQNNDANAFRGVPNNWKVLGSGDFNGDGRDDILWRSDTGAMSNWLGTASGGFVANDANAFANVSLNWHIAQIGDFNGDGRDDILWRSDAGGFSNWLGTAAGGFTPNDANAYNNVPTNWVVQSPDLFLL